MAQIIVYGNINHYAYVCVQDELHRTIRFRQVFVQDNHLTAMANDSPTSPEGKTRKIRKGTKSILYLELMQQF
jgi:hypothetical protein